MTKKSTKRDYGNIRKNVYMQKLLLLDNFMEFYINLKRNTEIKVIKILHVATKMVYYCLWFRNTFCMRVFNSSEFKTGFTSLST